MAAEIALHATAIFSVVAFACSEPWSVGILQALISLLLVVTAWSRGLSMPGLAARSFLAGICWMALIGLLQLIFPQAAGDPHTRLFSTDSAWATSKAVLLWSCYGALFVSAVQILRDRGAALRLCWTIFGLGLFTALVGLAVRSENSTLLFGFREITHSNVAPFGPFVNRDHAASFLAMAGMVGWGLLFHRIAALRDSPSAMRSERIAQALLVGALGAAVAFCIVKTGSRGGTHSFFLASFLMGVLAGRARASLGLRLAGWTGLAAILAAYAAVLAANPQWRGIERGKWNASVTSRVSMYESGLLMVQDHPISGVGLGAFRYAFPPYQDAKLKGLVEHVHSDWLEFLVEAGIAGFVPLAVSLALGLAAGFRKWRNSPPDESGLAGGALGAVVAVFIHMTIEFPFQMPANAVTLLLLVAIGASEWKGSPAGHSRRRGPTLWARAASLAFAAAASVASIPPIAAEFYFHRGRKALTHSQPYFFARALAWDANPRYAASLGFAYLRLAERHPPAAVPILRSALAVVQPHYARHPAHADLRALVEYLVPRLRQAHF